jgi:hypothetical protein
MADGYEKIRPNNQSAAIIAASRATTRTYVAVMRVLPTGS